MTTREEWDELFASVPDELLRDMRERHENALVDGLTRRVPENPTETVREMAELGLIDPDQ